MGKTEDKVLIIGQGGREHALARVFQKSGLFKKVFVAPGNPLMEFLERVECVSELSYPEPSKIVDFCRSQRIALVYVSPDNALAEGLVDVLVGDGIKAFGPTKGAARLEGSKIFAKKLMLEAQVPTAHPLFMGSYHDAKDFVARSCLKLPLVLKADGLALGKGVVVCETAQDLEEAWDFLKGHQNLVIEEVLRGREVSLFYFCAGREAYYFDSACDYKRLLVGNKGPNTGGMGSYRYHAETTLVTFTTQKIVLPILEALHRCGSPYFGILYVGLMITNEGPKVLEFNARLGDPEAQCLLPLYDPGELCEMFQSIAIDRRIPLRDLRPRVQHSVHVVKVSEGYPASEMKLGQDIQGLDQLEQWPENCFIFGAGITKHMSGRWLNSGGRVLGVTVISNDPCEAYQKAHEYIKKIQFNGGFSRGDVGAELCRGL
ncbi:MAG: phosphoribosylamine--glycine ligase [Bdellovibrionaceae bacterium]|nr:phosphoribosylamine--glycine ligase [Pseudobdellovibrionaceae bacterium]